jgi:hypothetical protein
MLSRVASLFSRPNSCRIPVFEVMQTALPERPVASAETRIQMLYFLFVLPAKTPTVGA